MASSKSTRLIFATGNAHKAQEVSTFLHQEMRAFAVGIIPAKSLEGLEETGATFAENAELKARFMKAEAEAQGVRFTLGDDSGFVVDALAGTDGLAEFPGIHSNRWLDAPRRKALLGIEAAAGPVTHADRCRGIYHLLGEAENRHGAFVCSMALYDVERDEVHHVEGRCPLLIRSDGALLGENGFGYDPMVHPLDAHGKPAPYTMAELSMQAKNLISHRGRALARLALLLETLPL